jgi:hypothetical protein
MYDRINTVSRTASPMLQTGCFPDCEHLVGIVESQSALLNETWSTQTAHAKWEDADEKTIRFGVDRFSELRVLGSLGGEFAENADQLEESK